MAQKPITVLVSACGAPGTAALMRAQRENGERREAVAERLPHRYLTSVTRALAVCPAPSRARTK